MLLKESIAIKTEFKNPYDTKCCIGTAAARDETACGDADEGYKYNKYCTAILILLNLTTCIVANGDDFISNSY